jgi:hypothetical protein
MGFARPAPIFRTAPQAQILSVRNCSKSQDIVAARPGSAYGREERSSCDHDYPVARAGNETSTRNSTLLFAGSPKRPPATNCR